MTLKGQKLKVMPMIYLWVIEKNNFIDTSGDTLSDTKIKTKANRWMTSKKICQYFTFNMGMSYTFVDVLVTDEGERD